MRLSLLETQGGSSLRYVGPFVGADELDGRPYCPVHKKTFRPRGAGYQWHLDHFHDGRPPASGAVLLVDDVITHGNTSEACRQLLIRDAGVSAVFGLFVGKILRN